MATQIHSREFKAMGSPCAIHLQGELPQLGPIFQAAQDEVTRLEKKYSRYLENSVLSQINLHAHDASVSVDPETAGLLNYAHICFEQSEGLFDITSGVLRRAWDFKSSMIPSTSKVNDVLPLVGWQKIQWDGTSIRFAISEMEIDFGGVGKEFAADRVAQLCRDAGISAGLIDLGGDISIVGPKTNSQGQLEPWLIGIRHPQTGEAMASIPICEGGVATSGSYERFIEVEGKRYCHILNPKTGWPVEGVDSISIFAPQCLVAGSLSTIAMLKGTEAKAWLDEQGVDYLLMDNDGHIHRSE